jgi:hypothetical protein
MGHPIPDIKIKRSPSVYPFLNLFRKMGVTEDDDLETLQKLSMGKALEDRGWFGGKSCMVLLITQSAQSLGNSTGEVWPCELNDTVGPPIFEDPSKSPIPPLAWVR